MNGQLPDEYNLTPEEEMISDTSQQEMTSDSLEAEGASQQNLVAPTAGTDSLKVNAAKDTTKIAPHLAPRILTFREQWMFASGLMVFVALMMASLQNFNPGS